MNIVGLKEFADFYWIMHFGRADRPKRLRPAVPAMRANQQPTASQTAQIAGDYGELHTHTHNCARIIYVQAAALARSERCAVHLCFRGFVLWWKRASVFGCALAYTLPIAFVLVLFVFCCCCYWQQFRKYCCLQRMCDDLLSYWRNGGQPSASVAHWA